MTNNNDKFLYSARPPVRPEFAAKLYQRFSELERSSKPTGLRWPNVGRFAWKLVALPSLILILSLVLSPSARAAALMLIQQLGGVTFSETQTYPYAEELTYTTLEIGVDQALAELPFHFGIPTWVPDGFVLEERVRVLLPENDSDLSRATNVYLIWSNPTGSRLFLVAQPTSIAECAECSVPIGEGSLENVEVNGESAAFVRGFWNSTSKQWDTSGGTINLRWTGDALYMLTGVEPVITPDDLIRIAESID